MKVLIVAHRLELGGTQLNAVDLAHRAQRDHGIDVLFAAAPGPAQSWVTDRGLELRLLPDSKTSPNRPRIAAIEELASEFQPDLIHVWDWPQCFDAYPGAYLRKRTPMLCTCMGMVVPRFIPRQLPTTFGTRQLVERARQSRSGEVALLEPPVDLEANSGRDVDRERIRASWGVRTDEVLVTMVSRLETWLKLESLLRGIDAVTELSGRQPVRLLIVGEGSAADQVRERAAQANSRAGREVVTCLGGMSDPRPAYAAADIMLGMGGSALRTMAFARPLVVMGERGFSRVLDESTVQTFLHQGWYGLGDGTFDDLVGQLQPLVEQPELRCRLGALGLQVVRQHYGLETAAAGLVDYYRHVAATDVPPTRALAEATRTGALLVARAARDRYRSLRGVG